MEENTFDSLNKNEISLAVIDWNYVNRETNKENLRKLLQEGEDSGLTIAFDKEEVRKKIIAKYA